MVNLYTREFFSLARERLSNRLRINVRVAVHVATDPRAEVQDVWYLDTVALIAINSFDGALYVFIKRWNRAIQNIRDEKQYVLKFVRNRHLFSRVFVGLPSGRCQ